MPVLGCDDEGPFVVVEELVNFGQDGGCAGVVEAAGYEVVLYVDQNEGSVFVYSAREL
jgi:hypothetical protein